MGYDDGIVEGVEREGIGCIGDRVGSEAAIKFPCQPTQASAVSGS